MLSLTWFAVNLVLGDDDLAGIGIISVFNGMAEDADDPDHLADFVHAVRDVARVADELLATGNLEKSGLEANQKTTPDLMHIVNLCMKTTHLISWCTLNEINQI